MNQQILFISEEHIGENATYDDANRIITLLMAQGWSVAYGDQPWQFDDEETRPLFEKCFEWAVDVMTAEKGELDEPTMLKLANRRFQMDKKLHPYQSQLLGKQARWAGYLMWLIETPSNVIFNWLKPENEKDVSKE